MFRFPGTGQLQPYLSRRTVCNGLGSLLLYKLLYGGNRLLIPIRILYAHIEMRKPHHGRDSFIVISEFVESLAKHFN
jgi:hypothetical protein